MRSASSLAIWPKPSTIVASRATPQPIWRGASRITTRPFASSRRFANALVNRGNARYAQHDFEGALRDCDQAIRLKPDYAEAFLNRAASRYSKGDFEDLRGFDEAIRLKPDNAVWFETGALRARPKATSKARRRTSTRPHA